MIRFAAPRRRRTPSLTPMIDVVFLLLVFFMLASQFGRVGALPIAAGGGSARYEGAPRLVEVLPAGLRLNGRAVAEAALPGALAPLAAGAGPGRVVVLRPMQGATLQRLIDVADALARAGYPDLAVVE